MYLLYYTTLYYITLYMYYTPRQKDNPGVLSLISQ